MKRIEQEEAIERINIARNNEYALIDGYKSFTKKAKFRHICGYEWDTIPKTIYNGSASCPVCAGHLSNTQKVLDFLKKYKVSIVDYKNGDQILTSNKYKLRCDECGYEWTTTLSIFIENMKRCDDRLGCPKCYNLSHIRLSPESYKKRFENNCTDFELLSDYSASSEKLHLRCKKCGHEFERYPADVFRYGCPACNNTLSTPENELYDFIKEHFPNTQNRVKKILKKKEIDIYIPDLKIGIEFDGLYWHSDCNLDKNYHVDKMNLANSKGIRLINIFEDEYKEHKDLVLDKLSHILNIQTNKPKVYGRQCVCKKISTDEKNIFLDQNHIQGHDASNENYGAYYNNELVAVMTFSKPKLGMGNKNVQKQYELSRFATNIKYNVIGAFGKLLKMFKEEFKDQVESIYSFADLRWVDQNNNIYLKNGFIKQSENKPTYYYCSKGKRYHRFGFRKAMLKTKFPEVYDDNLTEFEIMDKSNFYRIWDCGNIKYVLNF